MCPTMTMPQSAEEAMREWSDDTRGVAQTAIETYGQPDEVTPTRLIWHEPGPWKEMIATKESAQHHFPMQHTDSLESIIEYQVPADMVSAITAFDGSVTVRRTQGLLSARCHDEQANFLAVNLAHDIVRGVRTVDEARKAYVDAMVDYRAGKPTPYMESLQFERQPRAADPDVALTTSEQISERAEKD